MDDKNNLEKKVGMGVDKCFTLLYTALQYITSMYFTSKKRVLK